MTLDNKETWEKAQSKEYDKTLNMKFSYWQNHAIALLAANAGISESELIKSWAIEKLNNYGYSFENMPARSASSQPKGLFAILQELTRKIDKDSRMRRMAVEVLNRYVGTD